MSSWLCVLWAGVIHRAAVQREASNADAPSSRAVQPFRLALPACLCTSLKCAACQPSPSANPDRPPRLPSLQLAELIKTRFDDLDSEFDALQSGSKSGFKGINQQLDSIDGQLDKMDTHFEDINGLLVSINSKLDNRRRTSIQVGCVCCAWWLGGERQHGAAHACAAPARLATMQS